ncbi:MAG: hypothetical protein NZ602_03000 [Thermoguttaceae bacterium]|nr:hypothetical protein [Thermoguttaceae bacterium]MDW8039681.1 hypothetical protein [Thermoguttaceae bacterium]
MSPLDRAELLPNGAISTMLDLVAAAWAAIGPRPSRSKPRQLRPKATLIGPKAWFRLCGG